MLAAATCQCGSVNNLIQGFLKSAGCEYWLDVPIRKGKQKSLDFLNQLPQVSETDMLRNHIKSASKWAVIIGYDPDTNQLKWSDISQNSTKTKIEAELLVENFA